MTAKYNLSWHTYTDHLQKMLKEMNEFTDVTLICDGKKKIRSHRNILAGCSPVFKSIFEGEDVQNPVVFLRGITETDMESILQFIYHGEASFYQDRMDEFLQAARTLEIEGLSRFTPESTNLDSEEFQGPTLDNSVNQNENLSKSESVEVRTITKSAADGAGCYQCQKCNKCLCTAMSSSPI